MGYATSPAPHMLAFGMSGIGDVCDRFVQNDADLRGLEQAIDDGPAAGGQGPRAERRRQLRRSAILQPDVQPGAALGR